MRLTREVVRSRLLTALSPAFVLVVFSISLAATSPVDQPQSAAELTENAARLIQERELDRALQVLERAIEQDEEYWEAHYQLGRAQALSGRMAEALQSFQRGCELYPGFAVGHQSAAVAAMQIEDYETAWEQAIRAHLAGADVSQQFSALAERSEVPADIDARLSAWKVYVAGLTADEVEARADQERGAGLRELIIENAAEFGRIELHLRNAVSRSPFFGLVLDANQAQYALALSVDEVSRREPRSMEGYLRLYDLSSGDAIYYRPVSIRNIAAAGSLYVEIERYIRDMEEWKQRQ